MVRIAEATVSSRGQVSIPKRVRDRLNLKKGSRIVFLEDERANVFSQEAGTAVDFTAKDWHQFLSKTAAVPITRVKTRKDALRHLDNLVKKSHR
jgi:AbrB family looped-hinge helix DNA binding protein